jgi:hypothetical protein
MKDLSVNKENVQQIIIDLTRDDDVNMETKYGLRSNKKTEKNENFCSNAIVITTANDEIYET